MKKSVLWIDNFPFWNPNGELFPGSFLFNFQINMEKTCTLYEFTVFLCDFVDCSENKINSIQT